jgi:glucans biosynthesis protein
MSNPVDRRTVLRAAAVTSAAAGLASASGGQAFGQDALKLGEARAFSFDILKDTARQMARQAYSPPPRPAPEVVQKIDYEAWGKITFRTDKALFANGPGRFPFEFFHLGKFFQKSVEMNVVENGQARAVIYDQDYFDMPADSIARKLPVGSGFAGFRIQEPRDGALDWHKNDWVAFLGAAYFRAIGELRQYGLSARGAGINVTVAGKDEEFPDFTKFYIEKPVSEGYGTDDTAVVYALMDGPSVTGAFRFAMTRGKAVIMDIEQSLFLRADVSRFGLCALTTMFWFSETKKETAIDWRPEVHDSDGLSMWTGSGEHIWRPLNNPDRIIVSSFLDNNPRGFGMMQRDRVFDHYLDGVYYDRRPSLWVEPLPGPDGAGWGRGAVQLVEIPTDDEIKDNIVAMWVPEKPATAGSESHLRYKMYWVAETPFPAPLARCVATRLGNGGQPGQPRPKGVRKFIVEFLGGPLERLPFGVKPEPVLWASRGTFSYVLTEAVPDDVNGHWRAWFDLTAEGTDPIEMRCYLKSGDQTLSETWVYQYLPF